jgi:hypothetical protein
LPHRLNELCRQIGARLVHFSTDCVSAAAALHGSGRVRSGRRVRPHQAPRRSGPGPSRSRCGAPSSARRTRADDRAD